MKKILSTIGVIMILAGFISLCWGIDNYFAHKKEVLEMHQTNAADIASVAKRLEQKIDSDRASNLQERIWKVGDRLKVHKDPVLEVEYQKLLKDLKDLNDLKVPMKK